MIKTLKILRLLEMAAAEKTALEGRTRKWGIAVDKDPISLRWQRIDRQERKLKLRLKERLGYRPHYLIDRGDHIETVYTTEPLCALCYLGESICRCEHTYPHVPDTPATLIEELAADLDNSHLADLFTYLADGICLICGRDIPDTHYLCASCAGVEATKWARLGGMIRVGDQRL